MRDGSRMRHSGVGAAQLLGDVGVQLGEALDVNLVEDRVCHRPARGAVIAPVEIRRHQHRARYVRRRVAVVRSIRVIGRMTVDRRVPVHIARDRAGIGVEQQLRGIAADARRRIPRAVDPKAVALARCNVRKIALPHKPIALIEAPPRLRTRVVEQAQLDSVRHAAEQGEGRAAAVVVRAQRRGGGNFLCPVCGLHGHWVASFSATSTRSLRMIAWIQQLGPRAPPPPHAYEIARS